MILLDNKYYIYVYTHIDVNESLDVFEFYWHRLLDHESNGLWEARHWNPLCWRYNVSVVMLPGILEVWMCKSWIKGCCLFNQFKIRFLRGVANVSLRYRIRSSVICRGLGVELLLLCIEGGNWAIEVVLGCKYVSVPPRTMYIQLGRCHRVNRRPGRETISMRWPGNS